MNDVDKIILIIEDNDDYYYLLYKFFQFFKVEITRCKTKDESIEFVEKNYDKISLIFFDIRMPRVNGYDLIRTFKKIKKEIPVVICTALCFNREKDKSLEAGCDQYLLKPIMLNDIKEILNKYYF